MAKEAYYFSHDSNARQDEKILMLRAEHSWEGYGIYWALIEMMFESSDTALHHNKIKGIAVSYNIDITLLQQVINTCITEELFASDNDKFWSESLSRRKSKFLDSKEKKSEAGKKGMAKRYGKQQSNNGVITSPNKVKESKVKESKVNESKVNEGEDRATESAPSLESQKDHLLALINKSELHDFNLHHLDIVYSYLKVVDIEVIETAIKKSFKKHGQYLSNTLDGMVNKDGITKKEQVLPKPKAGGENEKHQGDIRHEQASAADKPITGGKTGALPSKWANVVSLQHLSG